MQYLFYMALKFRSPWKMTVGRLQTTFLLGGNILEATLQGTNISHPGKRKNIFKSVFGRGYVSSQEAILNFMAAIE